MFGAALFQAKKNPAKDVRSICGNYSITAAYFTYTNTKVNAASKKDY